MRTNFGPLFLCCVGAFAFSGSVFAANVPEDMIKFRTKVDREENSNLQTKFVAVNVTGLPTFGKKALPTIAGQTLTFTIGSASFQGTADSKGKLTSPFNAKLTGTTLTLKNKGLQLISLLPLAASPDGKDKTVSVHFKVTATSAGQAEIVLVDKTVALIYAVKNGSISGKGPASSAPDSDTTRPTVLTTLPANAAIDVALNRNIFASFSEPMDSSTLNTLNMTLQQGTTLVPGAVTFAGKTATFNPTTNLIAGLVYTGTISTGAKDLAGNALAANFVWTFTTGTVVANGPAPVLLGTAGNFVILAKSGIDTVPTSAVTGDIGVSPITAAAITGFSLTADSTNIFSTSAQLTGKAFASNYAVPTPSNLTTAVSDMETAYTEAAGRPTPDFTGLGAGDISGLTLVPGLYKWGTGVSINTDITLSGGPNDVWIFQISGDLTQANGTKIILAGGALPKNIFWQTFGVANVGTTAHFEGVILSQTGITLDTGASINGRLLAQTAVTIKSSTVNQPAP